MGNCILKLNGLKPGDDEDGNLHHSHQFSSQHDDDHHRHHIPTIKVVTPNGGVMELYDPIIADHITSEFPNHALFKTQDPTHSPPPPPLGRKDRLYPGQLYYLLPLTTNDDNDNNKRVSSSFGPPPPPPPYRMCYDGDAPRHMVLRGSGVWKVRLVINPEQLSEILSQDARTEELIDSVRTVAKCATAGVACTGSVVCGCGVERSSPSHR